MNPTTHHYIEVPVRYLRGSALLLELFLQWGLDTRPHLTGWEEYRMCGQQRWLSHNALQGMLEEFVEISGAPHDDPAWTAARLGPTPAMPWEGIEAPPPNAQN